MRTCVVLIVAACLVTFFAGLGTTALWEPDEPRFAEATRQMLLRGDFVTPWFNGRPRFEKPVLMYWLQLPFFAAMGATEAAARAPAAIAGLIAVLAVFGIGRVLSSVRTGLSSALVLATTFRFVLYARQGLTDVPVVAALACGLWAIVVAIQRQRGDSARLAYLGWVCIGIAILLKGPVGLLAPIIWSIWALLVGGRRTLARTRPLGGLAVAAVVAAPWYLAMIALHGRAFVDVALGYEILARYLSDDFPGRDRGFFYFWGVWAGDGMPWSLFVPPAAWWAWKYRATLIAPERRLALLSTVWFLTVILVFSASEYKLPHYILPAYPAMALAVGLFVSAAAEGRVPRPAWRLPAYAAGLALVASAVLVALLLSRAFEHDLRDWVFGFPLLLALGAGLAVVLASRAGGAQAFGTFAALAATLVLAFGVLATFIARRDLRRFQPVPTLAAAARHVVAPGEPLAVAGNYGAPGLVFYARHTVRQLANRDDVIRYLSEKGRRHCMMPAPELEAVRPLVRRPLRVQAEASVFSVRMKRLLERDPERASRVLVLVTAE